MKEEFKHFRSKGDGVSGKNNLAWWTGAGCAVIAATLASIEFLCARFGIPSDILIRDPAAIFGYEPFVGAISNLGILLWCSAATLCIFAFIVLEIESRNEKSFFLISGIITICLLLDDLFMFHEHVFPKKLGVSENIVYGVYVFAVLAYFAVYRKVILGLNFRILAFSCLFFALSVGIDLIFDNRDVEHFVEDGFKILGIFTWLVFFASSSYESLFSVDREKALKAVSRPHNRTTIN